MNFGFENRIFIEFLLKIAKYFDTSNPIALIDNFIWLTPTILSFKTAIFIEIFNKNAIAFLFRLFLSIPFQFYKRLN